MCSTHLLFRFEDDVQVALGDGRVVLSRPLDPDGAEGLEGVEECALGDVPGHAAKEDLAREGRVAHVARGKLAGPGAGGVVDG